LPWNSVLSGALDMSFTAPFSGKAMLLLSVHAVISTPKQIYLSLRNNNLYVDGARAQFIDDNTGNTAMRSVMSKHNTLTVCFAVNLIQGSIYYLKCEKDGSVNPDVNDSFIVSQGGLFLSKLQEL
jgi:hypothetical protein